MIAQCQGCGCATPCSCDNYTAVSQDDILTKERLMASRTPEERIKTLEDALAKLQCYTETTVEALERRIAALESRPIARSYGGPEP